MPSTVTAICAAPIPDCVPVIGIEGNVTLSTATLLMAPGSDCSDTKVAPVTCTTFDNEVAAVAVAPVTGFPPAPATPSPFRYKLTSVPPTPGFAQLELVPSAFVATATKA